MQTTQIEYLIVRSTGAEVGDVHDLIAAQHDPATQAAYVVRPDGRVAIVAVDVVGDGEYEIADEASALVEYVLYDEDGVLAEQYAGDED